MLLYVCVYIYGLCEYFVDMCLYASVYMQRKYMNGMESGTEVLVSSTAEDYIDLEYFLRQT